MLSLIFCKLRAKHLEAEPGDLTRPQAIIVPLLCLSLPECLCGSGKGQVALPLALLVTEAHFKPSTFYSSGLFGFIVCQLSCRGGKVHTAASPAGATDIGSGDGSGRCQPSANRSELCHYDVPESPG